jgi:hypothetical protein
MGDNPDSGCGLSHLRCGLHHREPHRNQHELLSEAIEAIARVDSCITGSAISPSEELAHC